MKKMYEKVTAEFVFLTETDIICASVGGGSVLTDDNGNHDGIGSGDIFA